MMIRKISPLARVAIATAALGLAVPSVSAQEAVTTPVGAMTYTFPANSYTTAGFNLLRPAVKTAVVASGSNSTVTISGANNLSNDLTAGVAYFLEVVSHTDGVTTENVGDRLEIDVAATRLSANSTITIAVSSPNNTATGDFSGLQGYSIAIRPHWTLGTLFGTGTGTSLTSATTFDQADQVHVWNGVGMSTFWFRQNSAGTTKEWRNTTTGTTNQNDFVIPPGAGVFVKRAGGTPLTVVVSGEVRMNQFVLPVQAGTRLIANPFPVAMSPTSAGYLPSTGFSSATTFDAADQIWTWNGSGISTYWLRQNSTGSVKEWRNTTTGTTPHTTNAFLDPQAAHFVKTQNQISPILVQRPF